jgi:hypothetical protein
MTEHMTDPTGTWALTIATPIGKLPITLTLAYTAGVLHGTAGGRGETVPLRDLAAIAEPDGVRLTWQQSVTRPMRLNLSFDVVATAVAIAGFSKAGRLPRSTVTGVREPSEK